MKESVRMEKINKANKRLVKTLNDHFGKELYEVYEERHNGVLYTSKIQEIKKGTI